MITFVISSKLQEDPQKAYILGGLGPQKAYIFYAIHFLYVFQKKSRNKLWMGTHAYYFLFNTFFSHVNNKGFFFIIRSPQANEKAFALLLTLASPTQSNTGSDPQISTIKLTSPASPTQSNAGYCGTARFSMEDAHN